MDKDLEKRCCKNCRLCGIVIWCDKLKNLKEYKDYCSEEIERYSFEKQAKRLELLENYTCEDFSSKWIEYPLPVKEIKCSEIEYNKSLFNECGILVKVRPCGKEYENKTYLGFLLGDLPLSVSPSYNPNTNLLTISTYNNPAIFIPELRKIVFGCESWWSRIENEKDLSEITDIDIENTWYVKLLKERESKDGE